MHTVPIHYSRYLLALIVLMLLVLYTVRVQSCRTYSPCPRPPAPEGWDKDLNTIDTNYISVTRILLQCREGNDDASE